MIEKWLDDDGETWIIDPGRIMTDTRRSRMAGCAPELLATCKRWLEFFDSLCGDHEDPLAGLVRNMHGIRADQTRAIIAKAEGRAS